MGKQAVVTRVADAETEPRLKLPAVQEAGLPIQAVLGFLSDHAPARRHLTPRGQGPLRKV